MLSHHIAPYLIPNLQAKEFALSNNRDHECCCSSASEHQGCTINNQRQATYWWFVGDGSTAMFIQPSGISCWSLQSPFRRWRSPKRAWSREEMNRPPPCTWQPQQSQQWTRERIGRTSGWSVTQSSTFFFSVASYLGRQNSAH